MAKPTIRQVAKSPSPPRVKMSFTLTPKTARQIGAASVAEGVGQSEIAERLFSEALSGYYVGCRGESVMTRQSAGPAVRTGPVTVTDRLDPAAEISPAGADAA